MSDSYQEYELACQQEKERNSQLLEQFATWLKAKQLTQKTIDNHLTNVDFYINEFLLYESPITEAEEGITMLDMYFGYWFIKKAMWASASSMKSNAASLKKFYSFLHEQGLISKEALTDLKETIKENMSEWLATLSRYDDPDIEDMEEVWRY
jgi:site-specific recombinase XerD